MRKTQKKTALLAFFLKFSKPLRPKTLGRKNGKIGNVPGGCTRNRNTRWSGHGPGRAPAPLERERRCAGMRACARDKSVGEGAQQLVVRLPNKWVVSFTFWLRQAPFTSSGALLNAARLGPQTSHALASLFLGPLSGRYGVGSTVQLPP